MIRFACKSDLAQIGEIERLCFGRPWTKEMIEDAYNSPHNRFVVFDDGMIKGYGGIMLIGAECEILNIAVKERFRKSGIAKSILARLIETAKGSGGEILFLEVNENNLPAVKLYEGAGFRTAYKREKYYGGDTALVLKKEL